MSPSTLLPDAGPRGDCTGSSSSPPSWSDASLSAARPSRSTSPLDLSPASAPSLPPPSPDSRSVWASFPTVPVDCLLLLRLRASRARRARRAAPAAAEAAMITVPPSFPASSLRLARRLSTADSSVGDAVYGAVGAYVAPVPLAGELSSEDPEVPDGEPVDDVGFQVGKGVEGGQVAAAVGDAVGPASADSPPGTSADPVPGPPVGVSVGGSAGRPVGSPAGGSAGDPVGGPVGSLVGGLVGSPVGGPVGRLVGSPVGGSVGRPVGRPVGLEVSTSPTPVTTTVLIPASIPA
mmetsp:Transcript_32672/g.74567  ORF Transcript_32672/g.74567 Transcript_32672/m.74567 type:complete len:292 (+) Transcript_32672:707-1582(+)